MIAARSVAELSADTARFLANLSETLEGAVERGEVNPRDLAHFTHATEGLRGAADLALGAATTLLKVEI
ncbi:hypothetical protein [Chitinimonas koreensis]|uniref:hypothetical protein n=1 Tax=Chitinimonas koreensis TaxID=356302 RepID=UPI000414A6AF|nr:hypothetical protein [Chitinimonas koreensis]QNM96417.1 hypothetical protein H9L41_21955 [Chitinimonas koreensis]